MTEGGLGLLERFEKAKREAVNSLGITAGGVSMDFNSLVTHDLITPTPGGYAQLFTIPDSIQTVNPGYPLNPMLTSPGTHITSRGSADVAALATPKKREEILEKMSYCKELINLKEDEHFQFSQFQNKFFDFFEKHFSSIYDFKDLTVYEKAISDLEHLISDDDNKKILFDLSKRNLNTNSKAKKKNLLSEINQILSFLDFEFKVNRLKENKSIENLKNFSKSIIEMSNLTNTEEIEKHNLTPLKSCFFNGDLGYIDEMTSKKNREAMRRKYQLLSTAFIKKSKSPFGEDDDIECVDINPANNKIPKTDKNKKLVLRNFLQIYLVKENEIFSQTYFSKFDPAVLYSYRKYRFYQIKFCISISESFEDIKNYIEFVKSLFNKYIVIYKTHKGRNFVKVIICGIGKIQSVVKKNLIKYINNNIKKDCLIKISLYSTIIDCLARNIKKLKQMNYSHHTNFSADLLKKITKKSEKIDKK